MKEAKFDIKKERVRFRRQEDGMIKWEIPELQLCGFGTGPQRALSTVLDIVKELPANAQIDKVKNQIEGLQDQLGDLNDQLAELETQETTLKDLCEQEDYFKRGLELLEDDARFGPYRVTLVGILDVGDTDLDKDLDFKVTLGW